MEPQFRTSFIPKATLGKSEGSPKQRTTGMGIVTLVTLVLFLGTIALAVGAFLYQSFLGQSITSKKASFERAQDAFEPVLITELARVDSRIDSAENLIEGHIAVSGLLELLEAATLKNVRFTDFQFSTLSGPDITISMRGEARSFNAVALQSDAFGENRFLRNTIFSNLNLNDRGNVTFDFSATVDPRLISYERLVEGQSE